MDKKFLEEMKKMMIQVFNDGFETLISPRFDEIDKKFEDVDRRFENIDKKFEKVDQSFEELNRKVDRLIVSDIDQDYQLKEHEKSLDKLERVVKAN